MKKFLLLVGGAMVLALAGCSSTSPKDLDGLKAAIDEAQAPDFGTMISEMHMAEDQLDKANKVYKDFEKNSSPYEWRNVYEDEGHEAAAKALQHRRNAEAALDRILQPLRDRLDEHEKRIGYLESLHVPMGTEIPNTAIYFDFGSATVRDTQKKAIDKVVSFLKTYPLFAVTLTGYTDTVGTAGANKKLASRRNDAVMRALKARGLPTHTVVKVAVGKAGGPDQKKDRDNRRVDIKIHPHGGHVGM